MFGFVRQPHGILSLRSRRARAAFLIAVATLAAPAARTATVVPLTLEAMGRAASDVFVGTVESSEAVWNAGHTRIETRVRVRVEAVVKGRGAPVRTVVVPGGIVGEIGMRTPGAPTFQVGERVLLLAEPKREAELRPLGLFQGVLSVRRDVARGIDVVDAPGPAWGVDGAPIAEGTIPSGRSPALPLDEVVRRLRGVR
jgi:hypothetical protein